MILIAYDGHDHSDHAIAVAASLLGGGRDAHVLYVWEPLAAIAPIGAGLIAADDAVETTRAEAIAETGASLARLEGFDTVTAEAVRSATPAGTLTEVAERMQPELVVLGSRSLHGLKALLEGSVSRHVAGHVHTPVLIVPQ
jgi:nucleotide-binding universal stress UspA family protein